MNKIFSNHKVKIILLGLLAIFSILIYSVIKCKLGIDVLQYKFKIWDFDLWSLSHIILYFFLVYLYPEEWSFIFILGVIWELIEYWMGGFNPKNISNFFGGCNLDASDKTWWYGKISDIVANSIGIILALKIKGKIKL